MAIIAFAGILAFHSVKKTMNCRVLIMPQRNFREAPSKMFINTFPVAMAFAVPYAASIVDKIASATSGSIYLGSSTIMGSPSLIS